MFLPPIPLIRRVARTVVGWLDDRGQAPIMRQHINDGTHRFRGDEEEYRGMTGVDDVLGLGAVTREDDEAGAHVDHNGSLLVLHRQYVAANRRVLLFAFGALCSIVALLGMNGVGPLSSFAQIFAGIGRSAFVGTGAVAALCGWRVAQSTRRAVALKRILRQRRLSG